MNNPPDDGAERAQPENAGHGSLNAKARAALVGGLRIAGHVEDAAGDPHKAQHGGYSVADVDPGQADRQHQKNSDRQPGMAFRSSVRVLAAASAMLLLACKAL